MEELELYAFYNYNFTKFNIKLASALFLIVEWHTIALTQLKLYFILQLVEWHTIALT